MSLPRSSVQISFRVSAAQRRALTAVAGGPSQLAAFVRRVVFAAAGLPEDAATRPLGRPATSKRRRKADAPAKSVVVTQRLEGG